MGTLCMKIRKKEKKRKRKKFPRLRNLIDCYSCVNLFSGSKRPVANKEIKVSI